MISIRATAETDLDWIREILTSRWGSPEIVSRQTVHLALELPGLVATELDRPLGLLTYRFHGGECEIVTLDAIEPGRGVGRTLLGAARRLAEESGCHRLWLVTTNDNLPAMRFYERCGFRRGHIYRDAVTESRALKPEIPHFGHGGIPISDEIEYVLDLSPAIGRR